MTLEWNVTVEEFTAAAKSMQCSKYLGPDGYLVEFYRNFFLKKKKHKLAPILMDMFDKSFESKIPQTLTQATTSLICLTARC